MPTKHQQVWNRARNILIYHELRNILRLFNESGIKTIVIGGAALAEKIYPDISLRPISDIDLLAREDSLGRIDEILGKSGYDSENARNDEIHYKNNSPDFTIHIDLHSQLPYLDESGHNGLWDRAVKTELTGTEAYILSPEDALIYAATDAAVYHSRITPAVLNDIALIIRQADESLKWDQVIGIIKRYHLEAPLYYTFRQAQLKVQAGIPNVVMGALKPCGVKALELRFYRYLLNRPKESGDDIALISRFLARPGRAGLLKESFLPPPDFMQRRYGPAFDRAPYLFYLMRFINHFWRITRASILWQFER